MARRSKVTGSKLPMARVGKGRVGEGEGVGVEEAHAHERGEGEDGDIEQLEKLVVGRGHQEEGGDGGEGDEDERGDRDGAEDEGEILRGGDLRAGELVENVESGEADGPGEDE